MPTTKPTRHQVTKKEVMDAIGYFHGIGMIHNHTGDSEHYIKILDENLKLSEQNWARPAIYSLAR